MERVRHKFATFWIWLWIVLCGISFFRDVFTTPVASIFPAVLGFFYVMLLFWYKWAFWSLIALRLLDLFGLFNFLPFEEGYVGFNGSRLSYAIFHFVNFLILFGILKIKNKSIGKSTWEQLKYSIRANGT